MNRSEPYKYFYRKLPLGSQFKFYAAVFCTFAPIWAVAVSRIGEQRSWLEVVPMQILLGMSVAISLPWVRVRLHGRQEDDQALLIARVQ